MQIDREEIFQLILDLGKHLNHEPMMNSSVQGEKAITAYLESFGPVYSGDLATQMDVGTGRIANALKSLEKKKLIVRRQDEDDRRKMKVSLTDKGHEFAKGHIQEFRNTVNHLIDAVGEEKIYRFLLEAREIQTALRELKKGEIRKC